MQDKSGSHGSPGSRAKSGKISTALISPINGRLARRVQGNGWLWRSPVVHVRQGHLTAQKRSKSGRGHRNSPEAEAEDTEYAVICGYAGD